MDQKNARTIEEQDVRVGVPRVLVERRIATLVGNITRAELEQETGG
jgi:hypothetical protein